jgi:hypothetical protein
LRFHVVNTYQVGSHDKTTIARSRDSSIFPGVNGLAHAPLSLPHSAALTQLRNVRSSSPTFGRRTNHQPVLHTLDRNSLELGCVLLLGYPHRFPIHRD